MPCSVLIHACATVGRWEEAEKIFAEQLVAAKTDEECKPNRITYRWEAPTSRTVQSLSSAVTIAGFPHISTHSSGD